MKALHIASIAHAINAAYCASLGDTSQPAWADAHEWQQQSIINGVAMHLANPDATPEQSHASWLAEKLAQGWTYGAEKDFEAKTHPCCLPYEQLPPEQKSKDYLFRAVVHALKDIPEAEDAQTELSTLRAELDKALERLATAPPSVATPSAGFAPGKVGVEYIGRRDSWADHHYGTGLLFARGEIKALSPKVATLLLRHSDLFAKAELDTSAVTEAARDEQDDAAESALALKAKEDKERLEVNRHHDLIAQVQTMTKGNLAEFALTRFGVKLDPGLKANTREVMEAQVVQLIHAHGTVI